MTALAEALRACSRCREHLARDRFYRGSCGDGLQSWCKDCARAYAQKNNNSHRFNTQEPVVTEQRCPGCKTAKAAAEFGRNRRTRTGLAVHCKACRRAKQNRPQVRIAARAKRVGLTADELLAELAAQGYACRICSTAIDVTTGAADHNHVTGIFRGWLCHPCNRMLGQGGDSAQRLYAGAVYLAASA